MQRRVVIQFARARIDQVRMHECDQPSDLLVFHDPNLVRNFVRKPLLFAL